MSEKMKTPNEACRHKDASLEINPETKIEALLENYPELENILVDLSPTFGKLKNPVLRQSVARITNLRQAAQIAGIELGLLINKLRESTGMETLEVKNESKSEKEKPAWVSEDHIVSTFDARKVIQSGGHPLKKVLSDIENMSELEIYLLITPFIPAPLVEMVRSKGYSVWTEKLDNNECRTYITCSSDLE